MEAALQTPAHLIAFVHKRGPSLRVLLPSLWEDDHPPKHARRQPLHTLALLGRQFTPDEKLCERSEDVMLRRHERDLLCAVLCERVARVHESRFDHFLPAVGRWKAVSCCAGREAGRVAGGGQKCDVETRVEAPASVRGRVVLYE
jgi:hypothetical protein